MKLFKSILLIAACHAAQASAAIDINADPNLTGAAPLTGILNGQQSDTQNMSGFDNTPPPAPPVVMSRMFGAQLFNGTSADSGATVGFNPDYILNPGDSIQVRLWGAFTFDGALQIDPKGNIFLPNVGPVKVAGVSNSQLNTLVTSKVKEVYQSNVNVYASLLQAQPVKVYVTGFVRNPGLYGGVTSDSLLNYLIKAGGVDPERGSYVDIVVKRGNRVRSNVNLYDFLLNGKLGLSQFADGDTIIVGPRQHTFSVQGDVFNSYDFEFRESSIPVTEALSWARPKPGATHITIMRKQGLQKRSEYYPISSAPGRMLQNGDTLIVSTDRYAGTIQVRVEGAHSGEHAMVLPYGSTMRAVLEKVRPNSMSQMNAVQLYRPSVAQRQKEMLNLSLQKLEEASLSAQSSTKEEASLRMQEAQLISRFVAKARTVVPKGEVILNESNIDSVLLEDGDVINIPEKTSLVMVHGEVLFPNAVSWQKGMTTEDYIEKCGGLTQKSGNARIIVIRQNGAAVNAEDVDSLKPGDEIMVLPKYESKNIEVTRGISTILYQLAVAMAKEVVVGTLNTLYTAENIQDEEFNPAEFNLGEELFSAIDETWQSLKDTFSLSVLMNPIEASKGDGEMGTGAMGVMDQKFGSAAAAYSYLIFVLLYVPCISVMGAIARESSRGWMGFSILWGLNIAYSLATLFYQVASYSQHPTYSLVCILAVILFNIVVIGLLRRARSRVDIELLATRKSVSSCCAASTTGDCH